MKMKIFEIENFRNFSISKFFKFSTLSCSNFLSNQSFLIIFFMDRLRFIQRRRWNRLERPKMHSEKDKHKLVFVSTFWESDLHETLIWRLQFRGSPHVGALTDLGAIFHRTAKKIFPWYFHGISMT